MKGRYPVEHFVDGRQAWKKEAFGLVRYRGYAGTIVTALLLGGVPWWWPGNVRNITLPGNITLTVVISLLGGFVLIGMHYLRRRSIRSLNMKHQLHMISHEIRDRYMDINAGTNAHSVERLSHNLCDLIQRYFSILTSQKESIGVAIRIAEKEEERTVYKTFGRCCLHKNRQLSSIALDAGEGVARILQDDKGSRGMLVYNDIKAAIAAGAYVQHPNDIEFPDDIKTMMVAPINGWDGEKKAMLGILYITSKGHKVFGEKHTDSVGFIADTLSNIYSELVFGRSAKKSEVLV